ncbi:uncharacterized protein BDR25DRAFT_332020 [Lindgomyces ingoldianus]|uniref:Uncharacterized protein n=1 Tax=Lindgomyces ingoldianus TaxID=673940 RepID=A0ACB6R6A2_9PLEO|nr:uncharacterized protein BDR25DRAFT_332020 [Lindgomyces ingoldianus]KAF2474602.1 hypothetical protein BDR25DRAFT_332020 [Lindgomyces ingoldianus]
MADLAAIFSTVSRGARLALELNELAATTPDATYNLHRIAKSVSNFSLTVKQVGTLIKENDHLPSLEAIDVLEDILNQCKAVFVEIKAIIPAEGVHSHRRHDSFHSQSQDFRPSPCASARLVYLQTHLDALRSTLSVMMQTLYTAESVMWARVRPMISPQQEARAVANEKTQLEALIIEQQMSLLSALREYERSRPEARLLMEDDSSQSLVSREEKGGSPKPTNLFSYQEHSLVAIDPSSNQEEWLAAVCAISKSHLDRLLKGWTRLRQLEDKICDEERRTEAQKRETQQPTCESDGSEDQVGALPKFRHNTTRLATPTPKRPTGIQPLFTDASTLPIPVPDSKIFPTAPLSPAPSYGVSPRSSSNLLPSPQHPTHSPVSPQSSISILPIDAAAAVEAKDADDDLDLKIPWRLCLRSHYWEYVDGKVTKSNTERLTSDAFGDRNSRTEILASWVDKEAIREAGYKYTQVQKERRDGRRTKFETCFCIQQPLTFLEVKHLVERTVEIYRQKQPASPPPRRRSSSDRPSTHQFVQPAHDRGRTPLANHPPLERSTTSYPFPPQGPPLDRSNSMPGAIPTYPSFPNQNPHKSSIHLPIPTGPQSPQAPQAPQAGPYTPQSPYFPQPPPYNPQTYNQQTAAYTPQSAPFASPQTLYPLFSPAYNPTTAGDSRRSSNTYPPSPLQQSQSRARGDHYSSTSATSDSDSGTRSRRHRSRSQRRQSSAHSHRSHKKKGHSTVGTLAKVGGLAALLDGIVDLGVL